ncbi:MAG: CPBP family intramembrane glutamate endopeptidase, partial [Verrucomicrobiota bacterium]
MNKSLIALLLLIPAPSIGTASAMMIWPDMKIGQAIFFFCKVWLLGLPLFWHLKVNKDKFSLSPPKHGGFLIGIGLGLGISAFIV